MTNRRDYRLDEKLGLDRIEAASYVGVSASLFDEMVADGRMPQPKEINARLTWDREGVREAFKALPDRQSTGEKAPTAPKIIPENPWNRGRDAAA